MKKRGVYLAATVGLFLIEILIAVFVRDRFVRPFLGDVLAVILVYCLARIFISEQCRGLPLYVFILACGIELTQYLNVAAALGLSKDAFVRIALGTSFDWLDILCYAIGSSMTGGIAAFEAGAIGKNRGKAEDILPAQE